MQYITGIAETMLHRNYKVKKTKRSIFRNINNKYD